LAVTLLSGLSGPLRANRTPARPARGRRWPSRRARARQYSGAP